MFFRLYCCNMRLKKIILYVFVILTVINGFIFVFRDSFAYQPYSLYSCLYQPCNDNCKEKWQEIVNDYSETELQQTKHITDSIVSGIVSTINKVTAIVKFLHDRFYQQLGKPSMDLMNASPLIEYKKLCSSKSEQLWCGNFAVMAAYFCLSQGIVTRNIEIMHPGNHHVLNECYIPETKSWIMTDATNNLLLVKNKNGEPLNLVSFRDSLRKKSRLIAIQSTPGSTKTIEFEVNSSTIPVQYMADDPLYYYRHIDNNEVYKPLNKIKRYFLPTSWYEIYDNNTKHRNIAFYLKEILFLLWIAAVLFFYLLVRNLSYD